MTLLELALNPYSKIGIQAREGLTAISSSPSSYRTLIDDYINGLYYPNPDEFSSLHLESIKHRATLGYINSTYEKLFNSRQLYFIRELIRCLYHNPIDSLVWPILEVNGALSRSNDMTAQEKVPIYFATAVAHRVWLYWYSTVFNPSNWSNYFDEDEAINFANIPFWVEAAVIGTLVCSIKADSPGFNETPSNVEIDPVGALTGGIFMTSHKVINKIVPGFRVREPLNPSESDCDCQGHSALQQQELNLLR